VPQYLLDTDHMTLLRRGGAQAERLVDRLNDVPEELLVTCVVVFEEQMRGWMAQIARMRTGSQFVLPYGSLATTLTIYCAMNVLPFDERASFQFDDLKRRRIRLGTQDLKIASIALANDSVILTRNTRDFAQIQGLSFEDWSV